jgi:two-component system, cell cycle sensor histidine kinase and response regulator CckA
MAMISKILIIDDDPHNQKVLEEILVADGHKVRAAVSGESAFKIIAKWLPDLILLDVAMPGTSGHVICRRLKANLATLDIPVLFISTPTETDEKLKAFEAGALDFITKPFSKKEVLVRVRTHLRLAAVQSQLMQTNLELSREVEARKAAEAQCQAIFEQSPNGIVIIDPDSMGFVAFNTVAHTRLGYSRDEFASLSVIDIVDGFSEEAFAKHARKIQEEVCDTFEARDRTKSGAVRDILISARQIVFAGRLMFHCVVIDITESKKAEEVIQQQLTFLQTLIDTIPSPIFYKDTDGRYLGCNSSFESFFGLPKASIIGKTVYDLVSEELADKYTEADLSLFRNPGVQQFESDLISNDDVPHTVLFIKGTFLNLHGKVAGLVGVMIDITELKKTEDALRKSLQLYQSLADKLYQKQSLLHALIDSIPDLIFYKDNTGVYMGCNKSFEVFAGQTEANLVGLTDLDIFPREVADLFREMDQQMLSQRSTRRNEEWVDYPDGRHVLLETIKTPYYDQEGNVLGLIGISRDITEQKWADGERKKLQSQLHQAQKMEAIGQLAGGIAHDFNNILTAIIGYSEILAMRLEKTNPLRHHVEQIFASAERAAELTNSLLAFSRKQVLHSKPLDLCEVVQGLKKMLKRLIPEDIDFKTTIAKKELIVMADKGQIEQVLMNLVTNAKDAMAKGGMLTIDVTHVVMDERFVHAHGNGNPGDYACISVSDTGHGMDEETQKKIFEPFFTTKEVGKGTGLGMAIIYGIVKQHDGYINVYSEPDKGTTFKIYLPITGGEMKGVPSAEMVEPIVGGMETVLLAEDDVTVRELHRMILEGAGYTVIEAINGQDALEKFLEHGAEIDILVTDVIMPKIDGKKLYEEIKKASPDKKVLFMSGYTKDIVIDRGILEDEFCFLTKPATSSELLKKLRNILDRDRTVKF